MSVESVVLNMLSNNLHRETGSKYMYIYISILAPFFEESFSSSTVFRAVPSKLGVLQCVYFRGQATKITGRKSVLLASSAMKWIWMWRMCVGNPAFSKPLIEVSVVARSDRWFVWEFHCGPDQQHSVPFTISHPFPLQMPRINHQTPRRSVVKSYVVTVVWSTLDWLTTTVSQAKGRQIFGYCSPIRAGCYSRSCSNKSLVWISFESQIKISRAVSHWYCPQNIRLNLDDS